MSDEVYQKLAQVLNTLPNGFPSTESGLEIKILKKIFTPEEAELFCDLRLTSETAEEISSRTGRPLEGLEDILITMWKRGEIWGTDINGVKTFKMIPWVIGIYEFQIDRMDKEFAGMSEEYRMHFGPPLLMAKPELMQVIPIEKEIPINQQALPYQQVSAIIEKSQSFAVNECICNKEKKLLGKGCNKPDEICLALSTESITLDDHPWGRPINREEAYEVLKKAEENALVHLSSNTESDQWFICNCCGCCCEAMIASRRFSHLNPVHTTNFIPEIDTTNCNGCGKCVNICPVEAMTLMSANDPHRPKKKQARLDEQRCLGCGLCLRACARGNIHLQRPLTEHSWSWSRYT